MKRLLVLLAWFTVLASPTWATQYYISPTGNNSPNDGLSTSQPWLTFAHAINPARASCGDTLSLMDGTYGDGTSTGKISISALSCAQGDELTIRAVNQRQASIVDSGSGRAIHILSSSGIVLDGLVFRSTNDIGHFGGSAGDPFRAYQSSNIKIKNSLCHNPNKYTNRACIMMEQVNGGLVEDTEVYDFHRHAINFFASQNMVARRIYAHPRTGWITGGYPAGETLGTADALLSMYPCLNCVLENSIAEGAMYLNEMNATFNLGILMKDSKVLGSICLNCSDGNGIYPNGRGAADLNHSPQNITIEHNALVGFTSPSYGIKNNDTVNITINRNTIIGNDTGGAAAHGIVTDDSGAGVAAASMSFTMTSNIVKDRPATGFYNVATPGSWSGDFNWSYSNGTAFTPLLQSNWGAGSVTTDPGFGDCKLWLPAGAAAAGRGAEILYRYVDGQLTTTPLWDPTTGEFPHGATVTGINDTASTSLYNVHQRLNVPYPGDTHTCNFPASYPGGTPPSNPAGVVSSQGTTSPSHVRSITAGMTTITVGVMLHDTAGNVGTVTGVTSSCGSESLTQLATQVTSPAYRRVYVYGRTSPTTGGSCTITATTTGTVTASVMISTEHNVASPVYGTFATATNLSGTPSVTISTNTGQTILDFLAGKCGLSGGACTTNLTAGANQTIEKDQGHLTLGDIRGAHGSKAGVNGGLIEYITGNSYWALAAGAICPTSCSAATNELDVTKYGFFSGYGTEAGATALAATSTPYSIAPQGMVRIRAEITAEVATTPPFGFSLFCRKNADAYTQALDTFGSNVFRLYGPGVDPNIPSSQVPTTARLTAQDANTVVGAFIRDQSSAFIAPQMASGKRIEMEWLVVLNAAVGDVITCQPRFDSGVAFTTYTVTPTLNIVTPAASGFAEVWDLLMLTMLPILGRIESQTTKPTSNLDVTQTMDQVMIDGANCTGLKTTGTGTKRTVTCLH